MTGLAGLSQKIATANKRPRPDRDPNFHADVAIMLDGLVTIRFRAIDPDQWARRTYDSSPRKEVSKDVSFGFNIPEVCEAVARISGYLVGEDGEEFIPAEMWEELWPLLPAPDKVMIFDAIFLMNQWVPQKATVEAKKAQRLTLERSAVSPVSSESLPDDSADGNPETSSTSNATSKGASAASSSPAKRSGTTSKSRHSSPPAKKS